MTAMIARRRFVALTLASAAATACTTIASRPARPFVYLLPAPKEALVFAPFVLAETEGLFANRGLAVRFERIAGGGAKVGEALAKGVGDAGGAIGDTAIPLHARGVDVRSVALLGSKSFLTLMTARNADLRPAALIGKHFGVPSFQDTSYYALKAWLASLGLSTSDIVVRAEASDRLVAAMAAGDLIGMVGTVDWGVRVERGDVAIEYRSLDPFYPAMAQAILAPGGDDADRTDLRAFIGATLDAIGLMIRDPRRAAARYAEAMPNSGFSLTEIARVFGLLGKHVYGPRVSGRFDPAVMQRAAQALAAEGQVPAGTMAEGSYTNRYLGR